MRVLVNYYAGGGGGFSNLLELISTIARTTQSATLVVIDTGKADYARIATIPNVQVVKIKARYGELSRLIHGLWGLRRIARCVDADVIWSINLGAYFHGTIPQVLSINNAYQVCPLEYLRYHPGGIARALLLRFFGWRSLKSSSGLIFQTRLMREMCGKFGLRMPSIIASKGVDYYLSKPAHTLNDASSSRAWVDKNKQFFTFLYVASFFPHKNHQVIINAIEILKRRERKIRVVLTLDAALLMEKFGVRVHRLIEDGYVLPIGWVEKEQLRSVYEACDACVMPSVLESLSSAHLEAMAWGVPQVVADMPYAREICRSAAVYVNPTKPHDWADAMEGLSKSRDVCEELVRAGRSIYESESASWNSIAELVFGFIRQIRSVD